MRRLTTAVCVAAIALTATATGTAWGFPVFVSANATPSGTIGYVSKTVTLQTVGGVRIKCLSFEGSDEITGEATVRIGVHLYTCTKGRQPCRTASPYDEPYGQMTLGLNGQLAYLNRERHRVGVLARLDATPYVLECLPEGSRYLLRGAAIARISPVDRIVQASEYFKLPFIQKEGVQKFASFEGSGVFTLSLGLEGAEPEGAGLSLPLLLQFDEAVEVAG
jgi:hypothetical protein